MQVGVNYPWCNYGWDFGLGPPPWMGGRSDPQWYDQIDSHLQRFQNLGINVVRWFILADGLTYGTGNDAPSLDPAAEGEWRFNPPPPEPEFLQHFEELLRRFENAARGAQQSIQLLPVLIDFHFCDPGCMPLTTPDAANPQGTTPDPDWVKKGRADAITDADKRKRFLDLVFDQLLGISRNHSSAIYAWELINEPDWITNAGIPMARRTIRWTRPRCGRFSRTARQESARPV
jgi:hypothetical protein